jgi:hypothetical protein
MKKILLGLMLGFLSTFAQAQAISDYLENKLIDVVLRGTAFSESAPASLYVALFTSACGDTAGGTEVTGGSYVRVAIARSVSAWKSTNGATSGVSSGTSGASTNGGVINFGTTTASWGTVTHWGLYDASSAGNFWICGTLTSQVIPSGAAVQFNADALSLTVQ